MSRRGLDDDEAWEATAGRRGWQRPDKLTVRARAVREERRLEALVRERDALTRRIREARGARRLGTRRGERIGMSRTVVPPDYGEKTRQHEEDMRAMWERQRRRAT